MIIRDVVSHNAGVRRVLDLAREAATLLETEAGTGTERDQINVAALRLFADQAEVLLLPETRAAVVIKEGEPWPT